MSDSAIPWIVACPTPLSMEFPRQEYWSGLSFPSPGDLPDPRIKPRSPALQAGSLPTEPPGKPPCIYTQIYSFQIRFRCWLLQNIRYSSLCYTHLLVICFIYQIRSDQISRSVVSDSLRPHESQHARPPCPSPTPGVH